MCGGAKGEAIIFNCMPNSPTIETKLELDLLKCLIKACSLDIFAGPTNSPLAGTACKILFINLSIPLAMASLPVPVGASKRTY